MGLAVVTILTTFLALITFEYWDLDSMTAWTMNFWDLFFEGRLNEFYEYTALNVHGAQHYNCEGNFLWLATSGGYNSHNQFLESVLV